MPEFEKDEFKFPDEAKAKPEAENSYEIEIEDDTPAEDRGREPMPKPIVEELDRDELDQYDDKAKEKLKQMRKVWHDERREKESAHRERQEAIAFAQKLMNENKRIKDILSTGEKEYVSTVQNAANMELEMAKKAYKEAYDSGDSDALIDAQQAMQEANIKIVQAQNFKLPSLQEEDYSVQQQYQERPQAPQAQPDQKLNAWQERNSWFGADEEMTAAALGLHEKLKRNGTIVGSDEYYSVLDKTMRKRFPENFGEEVGVEDKSKAETRSKPSTVVAPATRSTSSNKIRLKASQVQIAKKLGLTPEQYAQAVFKLEGRQNG
jgi:hypothetical protein